MDRWFRGGRESEWGMWMPSIDVRERDNQLIINADLPGLNSEDVKIEVNDEGLVIRGERKREHEEQKEGYYRTERSYGTFYRLVPLPEGANVEQAKANFKDGVLEVTVPIPEGVRKRREIPIESGAPKTRTSGGGA
jgi:HSP20 family protein